MLGDTVISVETAVRQAEERGHTLIDEIRILMVGLTVYIEFLIYIDIYYILLNKRKSKLFSMH